MGMNYSDVKARFPNSLVLCQDGNYFNVYNEDVQVISDEFHFTLFPCHTTAMGSSDSAYCFPGSELEEYTNKFMDKGYDVAIVRAKDVVFIPASPIGKAKRLITEYSKDTFGEHADFSDMHHIPLGHSSTGDGVHFVDVYADIINPSLTYQVDNKTVACIKYYSLYSLSDRLASLDFDELIAYAISAWHGSSNMLEVKTLIGTIIVKEKGDMNEYPGVYVSFKPKGSEADDLVACVEHVTGERYIQTLLYPQDPNEPIQITKFRKATD